MARPNKRCVVIFGKTGHGKSSLANALFGLEGKNKRFNDKEGPGRRTIAPQSYTAKVGDVTLRVIDTPGLFDQEMETIHKRWPDILDSIALGQPSIDAVIVAVDAKELYSGGTAVNLIQDCIGSFICGRVIICFTKYVKSGKSKEEIITEFNGNLRNGTLGCFWVFSDKDADTALQKKTRDDIVKFVDEIHERGFRPIKMEQFSEYTKEYFKTSIESLDSEVSLGQLRNSNVIKIKSLEMFLTTNYMETEINKHNESIREQRAAEARQRAAEAEARQRAAEAEARQRAAEAEDRQRAAEAEDRQRAAEAEDRQRAAGAQRPQQSTSEPQSRPEKSCILL